METSPPTLQLAPAGVEAYLAARLGLAVELLSIEPLGWSRPGSAERQLKTYGYGKPLLIRYRAGGAERRAVLRTMAANPFGHERRADRAAGMLLSYDTFNELPRHVRALDVGALLPDGRLISLGQGGEFFLLTDYVPGDLYAADLQRLCDGGALRDRDIDRAMALAGYLADIHSAKRDDPALYRRAVRDLVGGGEGIFGRADSYPDGFALADAAWLERVEQTCVRWRWRLKRYTNRLARVHGDFHPFNVLFGDRLDFWLLDRSRGGWGEPADDVSAMAINYLFFSLRRFGALETPFTQLWNAFWSTYLDRTDDQQLLEVVAPFFAWRALVVACPVWYDVPDAVRLKLFRFVDSVLDARSFDPLRVEAYLE